MFVATLTTISQRILWIPLLFAGGVVVFFQQMPDDFIWFIFVALAVLVGVIVMNVVLRWHPEHRPFCEKIGGMLVVIVAMPLAGYFAAQFRTEMIEQPRIEGRLGPVIVTGTIHKIEPREKDHRLYLLNPVIAELPAEKTPMLIRINTKHKLRRSLRVGDLVEARVELMAPPIPTYPGGFDTRRFFYFKQLGAIGYTVGRLELLQSQNDDEGGHSRLKIAHYRAVIAGQQENFARWINAFRQKISFKVKEAIPMPYSAIVNAMLIGETTEMTSETGAALRGAGTAHLVAISGLHVVSVAGIIFFAVSLITRRSEWLALKFNSQKIAAIISIIAIVIYLLLAGAPVSAQRAVGTSVLFFMAMIFDRSFDSLRSLALVAGLILLFTPENLFSPGLQMSFAAALSLIATFRLVEKRGAVARSSKAVGGMTAHGGLILAESLPAEKKAWWWRWSVIRRAQPLFARFIQTIKGLLLSSLAASISTSPFIAYHFHQVSFYSILANLVCVPLTNLVVMPLGIAGMLLIPLGLHHLAFVPMRYGVELILVVSREVAQLPGSVFYLPHVDDRFLVVSSLAFYIAAVTERSAVRWLALAVFFGNMPYAMLFQRDNVPDLIISSNGRLYAISDQLLCRDSETAVANGGAPGKIWLSSKQAERYVRGTWQQIIGSGLFQEKSIQASKMKNCSGSECFLCFAGRPLGKITMPLVLPISKGESAPDEAAVLRLAAERSVLVEKDDRRYSNSRLNNEAKEGSEPEMLATVVVTAADLERYGTHAIFFEAIGKADERAAGQQIVARIKTVNGQRRGIRPWQAALDVEKSG